MDVICALTFGTRRYDELSNRPDPSSSRQFCPDYIIATLGYDLREGQVSLAGLSGHPSAATYLGKDHSFHRRRCAASVMARRNVCFFFSMELVDYAEIDGRQFIEI